MIILLDLRGRKAENVIMHVMRCEARLGNGRMDKVKTGKGQLHSGGIRVWWRDNRDGPRVVWPLRIEY